jgi:tetratricopeptide (TPR) repeat protein
MPEPADDPRNRVAADVHGSVLQAGTINAGSVTVGTHSGQDGRAPGTGSANVPWNRLPRNVHGRDALVTDLVDQVRSGPAGIIVLHGGGGHGKTTIALVVAHAVRTTRTAWWVDAANVTSFAEGLREVALQAGAEPTRVSDAWSGNGSAPELLWHALDSLPDPWLLVVDNADDLAVLTIRDEPIDGRGWLRTPAHGTVLVTSRDGRRGSWPDTVRRYSVNVLDQDASAAILLDLAPAAGTRTEAAALADRLGGLPLALRLAGQYLTATQDSPVLPGWAPPRRFAEYGAAWDELTTQIATPGDGTVLSKREMLGTTWELSLDLLGARGLRFGRPVMRLLSFLGAAPIPYSLLDATCLARSPVFQQLTPATLAETLNSLIGVGLLNHVSDDALVGIELHPVVRDICRRQQDTVRDEPHYRTTCLQLLDHATEEGAYGNPQVWRHWRTLLPHCLHSALLDSGQDADETAARIIHRTAVFYEATGMGRDAESLYHIARDRRLRLLGPTHPDTLATRHNLAHIVQARGDLGTAEAEYRDILGKRAQALGAEHAATLTTRHNLAQVVRDEGQWADAETEFRTVLDIRDRVLGSGHRDTLATRHNLAHTLQLLGDLPGAQDELLSVLTARTAVLGPDHPSTLATRGNIAHVLRDQGRLDDAESEYRILLAIRTRVLGAEHPDTLDTRYHLARTMAARGDIRAAESEYRETLHVCESVLHEQHVLISSLRAAVALLHTDN